MSADSLKRGSSTGQETWNLPDVARVPTVSLELEIKGETKAKCRQIHWMNHIEGQANERTVESSQKVARTLQVKGLNVATST